MPQGAVTAVEEAYERVKDFSAIVFFSVVCRRNWRFKE
jgi:hypothetical protein